MLTYSVSVPPCITAVAHKRPWSRCQNRLQVTPKHAYTLAWLNEFREGWLCCLGIPWEPIRENVLTHNSSQDTEPQLSQLAEPLWPDSGLKRWNWCRPAISTFFLKHRRKSHHHQCLTVLMSIHLNAQWVCQYPIILMHNKCANIQTSECTRCVPISKHLNAQWVCQYPNIWMHNECQYPNIWMHNKCANIHTSECTISVPISIHLNAQEVCQYQNIWMHKECANI